jgi:hypothetical protein
MNAYLNRAAIGISLLVAGLIGGVLWGSAATQSGVEQAIRRNFTAAELLSRLQVEGEKMRRFEKEMFIYVANNEKREGYVKEFDGAYNSMLSLLDTVLAPSGVAFNDAERKEALAWKEAALFYTGQFHGLAIKAQALQLSALNNEQRAALTTDYNEAIKAGKDRFRVLLKGTEALRKDKEAAAQRIASDIDGTFTRLRVGVLVTGLLVIGLILATLRTRARGQPMGGPAVARP